MAIVVKSLIDTVLATDIFSEFTFSNWILQCTFLLRFLIISFHKSNQIIIWKIPFISIRFRFFLLSREHSFDSIKWRFNVENNLNFSPHLEHSLDDRFFSANVSSATWLLRSATRSLVTCCFPIARTLRLLIGRVDVPAEEESVVSETLTGRLRSETNR